MSYLDLESVNRIIDKDFDINGFSIFQISQTSESTQIKSATDNIGTFDSDNPDIRYQKIADRETLDRLNSGKTRKILRAMQVIEGKLYPPMATFLDKDLTQMVNPTEFGVWYKADEMEDPDKLFAKVEGTEAEMEGLYRARYAKDPTGKARWKAGPVAAKLKKAGKDARQVILSRYFKADRIVPDSEVADHIAKQMEGTGVAIPDNVVTPSLLEELRKRNVKIEETETVRSFRRQL